MEVAKGQALRQAYLELKRCEKARNFDRAFKTCVRILKSHENDTVALKCQVVCLMQMGKFDEALELIDQHHMQMIFEEAYCHYRLGNVDSAVDKLLSNPSSDDIGCKELLAQLLYKREEYADAYQLLTEVLKNSSDDFDDERKTNLSAILSELRYVNSDVKYLLDSNDQSYELLYNEACFLIAKKQYKAAEKCLVQAEEVCKESLEQQDATDEEIEEELYIIKAQIGCCRLLSGDSSAAGVTFAELAKNKTASPSSHAVVLNNLVCLRNEHNIFDARKKMKACQNPAVEKQLVTRQKQAICFNNTLISISGNQTDAAHYGIDTLRKTYGREDLALICEIVASCNRGSVADLDNKLRGFKDLSQLPLAVYLTFAQAYLSHDCFEKAFDLLSSLGKTKYQLGILSILIVLCESVDKKKADEFLASSLLELTSSTGDKQDETALVNFLEMSASFYCKTGDKQAAVDALNMLYKLKPNDVNVLANLMNAYLEVDEKKAKELAKRLLPMDETLADLDVDALENSNWMLLTGKQLPKRVDKVETPVMAKAKKSKKRKRKPKLPKNVDPEKPADPERWLPRYERAAYRKKKDKRMKDRDVGRGTQGAVTGAEGNESGAAVEVPPSPKPAGVQPVGPRQMHPAPQKPKKKKKGGRW